MGIYLFFLNFKKKLMQLIIILVMLNLFLIYRAILYHPYQSLYFNIFVPSSVKKTLDVDYTGLSAYHFLKKLIEEEKDKRSIKVAVNSWHPLWRMVNLLSKDERERIIVLTTDKKNQADYLYSNRIYDVDKKYYKKYDVPSNFNKFKELKIDNTIIYDVYKRSK